MFIWLYIYIIIIYICTKNDYVCTLLVLYVIELADHELYCSAEKYCGRKFHSGKFCGRNFRDFVRKQAFCNLCFDNVFRFLQMNTVTCSLFSSNNGTIYLRKKIRERSILRIAPKGTTIYIMIICIICRRAPIYRSCGHYTHWNTSKFVLYVHGSSVTYFMRRVVYI